jgi:hypothetical protein
MTEVSMIMKEFVLQAVAGLKSFAITEMSPVRLTVGAMNYDIPPGAAQTAHWASRCH